MVTIYDISKKTGYSPATVSKVLNNYRGTSKKANSIIKKAVEEMNYIPNAGARSIMLKKSHLIGIILHVNSYEGLLHPLYAGIIQSFKVAMENAGYDIIFINEKIGNKKVSFYDHCQYRAVDGVLIIAGPDEHIEYSIETVISSNIPKISVESIYNNVTTVLSNNHKGTTDILEYLYNSNHRNIGLVYVNDSSTATTIRYNTYIDFLKKHNMHINHNNIVVAEKYDHLSGELACDKFMKNGVENLPDAIFCICDKLAIGLINKFSEYLISSPEQISICGFDDISSASYFSLTTVRQNKEQIGLSASKELLELINTDNYVSKTIEINTDLVIRNTTKKRSL